MEQNLERNVVDDDDKGDLVRHASIQEMFVISFYTFANAVCQPGVFRASCGWRHFEGAD